MSEEPKPSRLDEFLYSKHPDPASVDGVTLNVTTQRDNRLLPPLLFFIPRAWAIKLCHRYPWRICGVCLRMFSKKCSYLC